MSIKLEEILKKMHASQASDLHLKSDAQPIIRKRGSLYLLDKNLPSLSHEDIHNMVYPLMDDGYKKLFLKHKNVDFSSYFANIGRFRLCVFSQKGTIRVVARAIKDKIPSFEELKLPLSLKKLGDYKNGLILITGATGSGKSTTAASLLDFINKNNSYHILTIEDPIEYIIHDHHSCVSQRELHLDYTNKKEAFKAALRQDPDVIFFGEIRDSEDMEVALSAANSGHLVISTLHTATTLDTLNRCLSFFEEAKQKTYLRLIVNTLRAIISQKLIPTIQKKSIPLVEIFFNTTRMKELLLHQQDQSGLYTTMEESTSIWGMQTFDQHIAHLYDQKIIAKKTALQFATYPENVKMQLDGFNQGPYKSNDSHQSGTNTENPSDILKINKLS